LRSLQQIFIREETEVNFSIKAAVITRIEDKRERKFFNKYYAIMKIKENGR
jgi:hypothetical protein